MEVFSPNLKRDLQDLLNKHGVDSATNTPDFILAESIITYLGTLGLTIQKRDEWHGDGSRWSKDQKEVHV